MCKLRTQSKVVTRMGRKGEALPWTEQCWGAGLMGRGAEGLLLD